MPRAITYAGAAAPARADARLHPRKMGATRTVGSIKKNSFEEIQVRVIYRDGFRLIDARVFKTTTRSKGHPQPSENGFCFAVSKIGDVISALQAAAREVGEC